MSDNFYVEFRSVIHGFHIYRSVCTLVLGELLTIHLYLISDTKNNSRHWLAPVLGYLVVCMSRKHMHYLHIE